jgi:hypothetical protein
MKSYSIEHLHFQISKSILLAQAYTDVPELSFIIQSCRLKPYDFVFKERSKKIQLYRWWFDEFGNSLKIIKNKRLIVNYNDLSLDRDKIVCTDLYFGLSISKMIKISKLVHLYLGKDEDLHEDCFILTFLGLDNYLRTYLYLYGDWQRVSPLVLGIPRLKSIANSLDIKYFTELSNKKNRILPCLGAREWISFMPPNEAFLSLVGKQCDIAKSCLTFQET